MPILKDISIEKTKAIFDDFNDACHLVSNEHLKFMN